MTAAASFPGADEAQGQTGENPSHALLAALYVGVDLSANGLPAVRLVCGTQVLHSVDGGAACMALTRTEFSQALRKCLRDSSDHVQLRAAQERELQLAFASWIGHVRATYQLVLMEPDGVLFQRASRRPQKAMNADAVRFLRALLLTPASELDPTAPRLAFVSNYGHNCTRRGHVGPGSFGINKVRAALDAAMSQLGSELNVAVGALRQRVPVLVSFRRPCDSNPRLPEDATDDFVNSAEWTEAFAKPNAGMIWEAMRQTQCVDAAGFLGRCLLIGAHDVDLQAACSAEIDFMYGSQGALKRLFESPDPASLIISGLNATTSDMLWPRKPLRLPRCVGTSMCRASERSRRKRACCCTTDRPGIFRRGLATGSHIWVRSRGCEFDLFGCRR